MSEQLKQEKRKSNYLFHKQKKKGKPEKNDQTKVTKPDMSYTPAQLIERQRKGLPMPGLKDHFFGMDVAYPNLQAMDLTEKQEWAEATRKEFLRQKEKVAKKEAALAEQRKEALKQRKQYDEAIAEFIKQKQSVKPD